MSDIAILLIFAGVALAAAWLVNFLVALIRGEHSKDTGRVWWDLLLRMLAHGELGVVGRVLNFISASWARLLLTAVGIIALVVALVEALSGD